MFQARQGDVWIESIKAVPATAKPVKRTGDVILAYGEVTGHAHRIVAPIDAIDVLQEAERIILNVHRAVTIRNEEHASIRLLPGVYESYVQREFDPLEAERRVVD